MKKAYFYKLIPPRKTFGANMTGDERDIMLNHIEYRKEQMQKRKVVAFGPVLDPNGAFGVGTIQVNDESETKTLAEMILL